MARLNETVGFDILIYTIQYQLYHWLHIFDTQPIQPIGHYHASWASAYHAYNSEVIIFQEPETPCSNYR